MPRLDINKMISLSDTDQRWLWDGKIPKIPKIPGIGIKNFAGLKSFSWDGKSRQKATSDTDSGNQRFYRIRVNFYFYIATF